MKKLLVLMLMVFCCNFGFVPSANAMLQSGEISSLDDAGFNKLSAAQKAQIIASVEEKSGINNKETVIDVAERWTNIGVSIGKGMSGAAKELGVAVNEFAKTDVGKMVMMVLIVKFLGAPAIHIIGGLMVWIIGFFIVQMMFLKSRALKYNYDNDGKILSKYRDKASEDLMIGWMISNLIILVAGLITIFSF